VVPVRFKFVDNFIKRLPSDFTCPTLCVHRGEAFVEINIIRRVKKILAKAVRDGLVMGFVEYEKAA
jgi:hypothetical protein